jgi:hypothetical protein
MKSLLNSNDEKLDSRLNFIFYKQKKIACKTKNMALEQLMKSYDFTIAKKKSTHPLFGIWLAFLLANHNQTVNKEQMRLQQPEENHAKKTAVLELSSALNQDENI